MQITKILHWGKEYGVRIQIILTNVKLRSLWLIHRAFLLGPQNPWDLDKIPRKGTDCAGTFSLMEYSSSVDTMDKSGGYILHHWHRFAIDDKVYFSFRYVVFDFHV